MSSFKVNWESLKNLLNLSKIEVSISTFFLLKYILVIIPGLYSRIISLRILSSFISFLSINFSNKFSYIYFSFLLFIFSLFFNSFIIFSSVIIPLSFIYFL